MIRFHIFHCASLQLQTSISYCRRNLPRHMFSWPIRFNSVAQRLLQEDFHSPPRANFTASRLNSLMPGSLTPQSAFGKTWFGSTWERRSLCWHWTWRCAPVRIAHRDQDEHVCGSTFVVSPPTAHESPVSRRKILGLSLSLMAQRKLRTGFCIVNALLYRPRPLAA